jgi:hypothetical protein
MTDALGVAGMACPAPDACLVQFGGSLGYRRDSLVINSGLWPSALILVGNATLVESERVYM